jgi:hypothetical protein
MTMFTRVLLMADGSELSQGVVIEGVLLAMESNARITGISVAPEFDVLTLNTTMPEDAKQQFLADRLARTGAAVTACASSSVQCASPGSIRVSARTAGRAHGRQGFRRR